MALWLGLATAVPMLSACVPRWARVQAMGFPSEGAEGLIRNPMEDVIRLLEERHKGHYKVYNLCPAKERTYDPKLFHCRVSHYPFNDHGPPQLKQVIDFCEDSHEWLQSHEENIIAVHCKVARLRLAPAASAPRGTRACALFGRPLPSRALGRETEPARWAGAGASHRRAKGAPAL